LRLYLSSFRMGDHPEHLVALVGADSRRRVVIANAMDDAPPDVRRTGVELERIAYRTLQDGQAMIVNGVSTRIV